MPVADVAGRVCISSTTLLLNHHYTMPRSILSKLTVICTSVTVGLRISAKRLGGYSTSLGSSHRIVTCDTVSPPHFGVALHVCSDTRHFVSRGQLDRHGKIFMQGWLRCHVSHEVAGSVNEVLKFSSTNECSQALWWCLFTFFISVDEVENAMICSKYNDVAILCFFFFFTFVIQCLSSLEKEHRDLSGDESYVLRIKERGRVSSAHLRDVNVDVSGVALS